MTFVLADTNTPLCTSAVTLTNSSDSTAGAASCSGTIPLSTTGQTTFTLGIKVGDYYTRYSSLDLVVGTVATTATGFVTGGGYLNNVSSVGQVPGTPGAKTNFGFNVKYNKSSTNLQGQINVIVRSKTVAPGDTCAAGPGGFHVYQIKSNNITSLAVNIPSTTFPSTATAIAYANLQDVTGSKACSVWGGGTIILNMTDGTPGGQTDMISIQVFDKNNILWFGSALSGSTIVQQLMSSPTGGGNVTIH